MTVESTDRRTECPGNDSGTVFSSVFAVQAAAHLSVTHVATDGTETDLVLDTDYEVSLAESGVASVTFPKGGSGWSTLATGETLVIVRDVPLTQELDLQNYGEFNVELVERALDRSVMVAQQLQEQLERTVMWPVGETAGETDADAWLDTATTARDQAVAAQSGAEAAATAASASATAAEIALAATQAEHTAAVADINSTGDTQVARVVAAGTAQTANAQAQAEAASASATAAQEAASSAAVIADAQTHTRTIGGLAYQSILGFPCPPALEVRAWDSRDETYGYPSLLTFTRASAATRITASGYMEDVDSGILRHDYDPDTGEYLGVLVEESRTNLFKYTKALITDWTSGAGLTVTAGYEHGLYRATEMTRLQYSGSGASYQLQAVTLTSGTTYTISVYGRAIGAAQSVSLFAQGGAHLDTQTWGTTFARHTYTFTATYTGTNTAGLDLGSGTAKDISVECIQIEAGANASSYILTTTASATRAADVLSVAVAGFPYRQDQGTVYVEFEVESIGADAYVFTLYEDASNHISLYIDTSGDVWFIVLIGGATQIQINAGAVSVGTRHKMAVSWLENDFAACLDGGTVGTGSPGTVPNAVNTLYFGSLTGIMYWLNGHLPQVACFPRRLSNAQLQTLTS